MPKLNLFFCFCQHLRRGVGISLQAFTVDVVQAPDSLIINVTLVTSVEIIGKQFPPTIKFRVVSWHHLFPVITTNRHFSCEISRTVWRKTSHKQEHFVTLISSWNWSPWERSTKSNRPQLFFNHDTVQQAGLREIKPARCCFCSWLPSCVQARYCGGIKALCPLSVSVSTNEQTVILFSYLPFKGVFPHQMNWHWNTTACHI